MKKLLLIILFSQCLYNTYAWEASITFYVEDNVGRRDSVTFGVIDNSTLDIDTVLGESNIFGVSFDSLDIRVIQRDSLNFNCIRTTHSAWPAAPNLYFPNNIDSKIDFRPFNGFYSVNNNFEIYVHAIEFPITITAKSTGITGHASSVWADFFLLDNNCNASKDIVYNPPYDTLTVITDSSLTTLIAHFQHEVGIKNYKRIEPIWTIFPNPTNSSFSISSDEKLNGVIEIINVNGQKLNSLSIDNTNRLTINLEDKQDGVYFINYFEDKKGTIATRKLIKK